MPDVVLASDAPPVAVSATVNPRRPATDWACSTRRPLRASFSIGCHEIMTFASTDVSGSSVVATSSRMAASTAARPSTVVARTSTSSSHRSGTTLGRVPPAIFPTLTLTPASDR